MRQRPSSALLSAIAFTVALGTGMPVFSQDAPVVMPTGQPKKDINDTPPVNPLEGLFQMQPQYPTPGTTQMFPDAVPAHMGSDGNVQGRNPGTASNTFQQPFKDTDPKPAEKIERTDNGLKGLFQMQPQYPTPGTTQMFPEAVPKFLGDDSGVAGRSPGTASNTFTAPWKDPNALPEKKSEDKTDYLKDLFQMQPQYPTPGTTNMFPTATSPQFGPDGNKPAQQPGTAGERYQPPLGQQTAADVVMPGITPVPGSDAGKADSEKKDGDAADKKDGDKKDADSEKKDGDADKKEGDADKKDGDKKDGDKKDGDKKDADADKKDPDKKDDEKKDSDKAAKDDGKKADGKEQDKKDAKATDKKDGDKKDDGKKDDKDAKSDADKKDDDKKKEEVKYLPFNPIRESINLLNSNRLQESNDLLTREIKKDPKNVQALYIRATVQVKMRQYDKAAADYNEVLKLSPTGELATRAKAGLSKIRF